MDDAPASPTSDDTALLRAGENCYGIGHADRLACIVDAADYFRHAKAAMRNAQRRIILIGWDFDTRIRFEPQGPTVDGPAELGEFLEWLLTREPDLDIRLLKWSVGAVTAISRGMAPVFLTNLFTHHRIDLEIDTAHPLRGAHHQKIIVIDDQLAFCGGIDMTVDRWDQPDHLDDNPRRVEPNGDSYGPWHDATTAVDGDAARLVGEVARQRWQAATGTTLAPIPPTARDPWPADLLPTLRAVDVAVARTLPELKSRAEVREIERLYLSIIGAAREVLNIESQYLAARALVEALIRRLEEPDGPEIVVVLPRNADGWLERKAMDAARRRLLHKLWKSDHGNRFRAYYPVTEGGDPIYVHAKVVVMDDALLRVGSSNLNNRSLGLDSECDLAIHITGADTHAVEQRTAIAAVRDALVAEHLGVTPEEVRARLDASGSLIATIEALRGSGRRLVEFDAETVSDEESVLGENDLMDPETARGNPTLTRVVRFLAGKPFARARH